MIRTSGRKEPGNSRDGSPTDRFLPKEIPMNRFIVAAAVVGLGGLAWTGDTLGCGLPRNLRKQVCTRANVAVVDPAVRAILAEIANLERLSKPHLNPAAKAAQAAPAPKTVEVKGKLRLFGCRPRGLYAWENDDGTLYYLNFPGAGNLLDKAWHLQGKRVVMTGKLVGGVILVTSVERTRTV
jgi:hypothetical protein